MTRPYQKNIGSNALGQSYIANESENVAPQSCPQRPIMFDEIAKSSSQPLQNILPTSIPDTAATGNLEASRAGHSAENTFSESKAEKILRAAMLAENDASSCILPEAPESSNTGACTSQEGRYSCGLDTLHLLEFGCFREADALFSRLEAAQVAAEEGKDDSSSIETPDGDVLLVDASVGPKMGCRYHFILRTQGMTIYVRRRASYDELFANVVVHLGSALLMERGAVASWESAMQILRSLGWEGGRELVSRFDLRCDLVGVDIREFASRYEAGMYVSRSRCDNAWRSNRRVESIYFSPRADTQCRIYDKALEVRNDPLKQAVFVNSVCGGVSPACATRVEFQMRRKDFKKKIAAGISDFKDLMTKLPWIVDYLTTSWLRFTDDIPDRENNHQGRCDVAGVWTKVRASLEAFAGQPGLTPVSVRKLPPNIKQLKSQLRGLFTTIMAITGEAVWSAAEIVGKGVDLLVEEADFIVDAIGEKRRRLASAWPSPPMLREVDIPF